MEKNPVWNRVVRHLKDELGFDVEDFESESHASEHIIEVFEGLLDRCNTAVIVLTGDDETAEGKRRARQNVIHETGLFQSRHGFNKVFLLMQAGIEDFSNIHGLQVILFTQKIEDAFYELDRALKKLNQY
jgi:predicted nucleotide-binding protein